LYKQREVLPATFLTLGVSLDLHGYYIHKISFISCNFKRFLMFFAVFNDSHVVLPGNPFCSFQDFICAYSKLNTILSAWAFSLIFSWSCAPMLLDYNFFKIWNICHSFLLLSRQRKWRNSIPRISPVHFWFINSQQGPLWQPETRMFPLFHFVYWVIEEYLNVLILKI
jgi:hypothetical protein